VNYGSGCVSESNSCGGINSGTILCNGSCSAVVPANPANYGSGCSSVVNSCGQSGTGTIQCNGSCSSVMPIAIVCNDLSASNYGSCGLCNMPVC
jgi:hypothetical protein